MREAALFIALLCAPASASAQEAEPAPAPETREHVLSLHTLGLLSGGVGLQYEHLPSAPRRWSFAFGVGSRLPAGGDYASFSLGLSAEARWWAFSDAAVHDDDRIDGGFFVAGRIEVGWAHVWDTVQDRAVGDTLSVTHALSIGWRFDIARRIEITPSLGFAVNQLFDPGGTLAPWTRSSPTLSLTLGTML